MDSRQALAAVGMLNASKKNRRRSVDGEDAHMGSKPPDSEHETAERFFQRGLEKWKDGRLDEAQEAFERCLSIDPAHAPAYSARAGLYHWLDRDRDALDDISHALTLRPDHPGDLHNRAVVLATLGREAEAIREYESVLRLQPSSAGTLNNLAWLLATADDPELRDCRRAIGYARQSVDAARNAAWIDTLATAHAECGEFDRAVEIETQACDLAKPRNQAFERRLDLYRRGIPYTRWVAEQK